MSCGMTSLLTKVTRPPTAIVNSFGLTPARAIVTTAAVGAAGGATGAGEGAVGAVGDDGPEPQPAANMTITPAEIAFASGKRMVTNPQCPRPDAQGQERTLVWMWALYT